MESESPRGEEPERESAVYVWAWRVVASVWVLEVIAVAWWAVVKDR